VGKAFANRRKEIDLSGVAYEIFVNSIKQEGTADVYASSLRTLMKETRTSLVDQLLQQVPQGAEGRILQFIDLQTQKRTAPKTIRRHISAIKRFYSTNNKVLNWSRINGSIPPDDTCHHYRAFTQQEFVRIVSACNDVKEQALVLLLATSAINLKAIATLEHGDLYDFSTPAGPCYKIKVRTGKKRYPAFCSPQCKLVIDSYLYYRQKTGEKIHPRSPLFPKYPKDNDRLLVQSPRRMTPDGLRSMLRNVIFRSGVRRDLSNGASMEVPSQSDSKQDTGVVQCFRGFFTRTLEDAGVDQAYIEALKGSITNGVSRSRPNWSQLFYGSKKHPGYYAAIKMLDVFKEEMLFLAADDHEPQGKGPTQLASESAEAEMIGRGSQRHGRTAIWRLITEHRREIRKLQRARRIIARQGLR
jgi:site-specific recombinase XerD